MGYLSHLGETGGWDTEKTGHKTSKSHAGGKSLRSILRRHQHKKSQPSETEHPKKYQKGFIRRTLQNGFPTAFLGNEVGVERFFSVILFL